MTEPTVVQADAPGGLFTTATGGRLHRASCPHLLGKEGVRPATAEEATTRGVCALCAREAAGTGRIACATLDEAFRVFGLDPGVQSQVRATAAQVQHDAVWVVRSRSHIALAWKGRTVLGVKKSTLTHSDGRVVSLVGSIPRYPTPGRHLEERTGAVCPTCYQTTPMAGGCESCD